MTQDVEIVGIQNNIKVELTGVEKFIAVIVPEFVKDVAGILSDQCRFLRLKNQVKILEKAERYCSEHGIKPQKTNLKFLVPLIENSSLEEDESMQNMWAALLVSAITVPNDIQNGFIDILRQISAKEALILDVLYTQAAQKIDYQERGNLQFSKRKVMEAFFLDEASFDVMIDNLFRLNLCRPPGIYGGTLIGGYPVAAQTKEMFELTSLGFSFIQACKFNNQTENKTC